MTSAPGKGSRLSFSTMLPRTVWLEVWPNKELLAQDAAEKSIVRNNFTPQKCY
jgi:hypothetical protein